MWLPELTKFPADLGFELLKSEDWSFSARFPQELNQLSAGCSSVRREHFVVGRCAARGALKKLGVASAESVVIGRGDAGDPLWPEGLLGSISHCRDYSDDANKKIVWGAALVGRVQGYRGIGIDIEHLSRDLSLDLLSRVCSTDEARWVSEGATGEEQANEARLLALLSAKESLYKALFPQARKFFGFHDAELAWVGERGGFRARLLTSLSSEFPLGASFDVQVARSGDLLLTWLAIPLQA